MTGPTTDQPVPDGPAVVELVRLRWAVRAVLTLGVGASVAANVLHAADNAVAQTIAGWPPLALLLTVELIARVPVHRLWLAVGRLVAAGLITAIAGWVSYWHMAAVAVRYGEQGISAYLLPLSVDGLIVVASICLVELGGRIRTTSTAPDPAAPTPAPAPEAKAAPATAASSMTRPSTSDGGGSRGVRPPAVGVVRR